MNFVAKTDFYTLIGLYSQHASGIKSTIWNPTDLVPDAELKALTDAYWSETPKERFTKRPRKEETNDNVFDDHAMATHGVLDQTKQKSIGLPPSCPRKEFGHRRIWKWRASLTRRTKAATEVAVSKPAMSKPTKPN
ncbi:hypothetical protein V565_157610 [Rhizoctonia solani 123E]|uniref:Uncharacterized protein n=1 Tax=Rhizoctonia solani 123E TaxID=1423351 RepID=A0A074SBI6_9AGAM|nr:hypothetical protein V565_157610 [Rhizoctonia solani 123E]